MTTATISQSRVIAKKHWGLVPAREVYNFYAQLNTPVDPEIKAMVLGICVNYSDPDAKGVSTILRMPQMNQLKALLKFDSDAFLRCNLEVGDKELPIEVVHGSRISVRSTSYSTLVGCTFRYDKSFKDSDGHITKNTAFLNHLKKCADENLYFMVMPVITSSASYPTTKPLPAPKAPAAEQYYNIVPERISSLTIKTAIGYTEKELGLNNYGRTLKDAVVQGLINEF